MLTSLAALVSAAAGGMMYVFSTFVMRGLDRTGPLDAITAMRGINAEANANPAFLLGYFSAAILALAVGVPLNNHLDSVNPVGLSVADAAREWQAYMSTWTAWNHVRTITSFAAAALMLVGLRCR